MFYYPIMAPFGYIINEIVRFHTNAALKWNYISASTRIHQDFEGAAYKESMQLGSKVWDPTV